MSTVIFCTAKLPFARYIAWWTRGYGHAAIVSELRPGMWLDATFSGFDYHPARTSLHKFDIVELPFDLEDVAQKYIGTRYNFRGLIATFLRFRWNPNGLYCSQAILRMCAEAGHPMIDPSDEDEIDPVQCRNILKAYLRGLWKK